MVVAASLSTGGGVLVQHISMTYHVYEFHNARMLTYLPAFSSYAVDCSNLHIV